MRYFITKGHRGAPCTVTTEPSFDGRELMLPEDVCKVMMGAMSMYAQLNDTIHKLYDTPPKQHEDVPLPAFVEAAAKPKTLRAK